MSRENPTPAEVIASHRWKPQRHPHLWFVLCGGCDWSTDMRNTGKSALMLHAEHVLSLLSVAIEPRVRETLSAHILTDEEDGWECFDPAPVTGSVCSHFETSEDWLDHVSALAAKRVTG